MGVDGYFNWAEARYHSGVSLERKVSPIPEGSGFSLFEAIHVQDVRCWRPWRDNIRTIFDVDYNVRIQRRLRANGES